ncbi:hypothetical protein FDA52_04865 [Clostridium botulinum]|uniref:hypothetical protein n=1 Tax=Clostridium botulinum TaxID=1491 RepID=UPI0013FE7ED9|nr:hypothetical protein [Clostridium botulinum]MBN1040209.1 hypothetical protein [Clostridium botulinum]NFI52302.1 hypothetical protein [Clostridium botulinum]HBJ2623066.1 hypothetical protein [Clostridium botulinum]
MEQLSLFNNDIHLTGQKIEYISCGKKYKGEVIGCSFNDRYVECTSNEEGYSGVHLPLSKLDVDCTVK